MLSQNDKDKLLDELRKGKTVVAACKKLNINDSTYYRWVNKDYGFSIEAEEAKSEGVTRMCDIAESVIHKKVFEQDLSASKYLLSHNHPRYKKNTNNPDPPKKPSQRTVKTVDLLNALAELKKKNSKDLADPNDSDTSLSDQQTSS